jgi:triacylglycerol lipase
MDSLHLVDPELRPKLEALPTITVSSENLEAVRNAWPPPSIDKSNVEFQRRLVAGPPDAPDLALSIYLPRDAPRPLPCIYHMHGGGYIAGAAADLAPLHYPLARDVGTAIISVDYRLAPETIFPGAIEDCYAGLRWVFEHCGELNIDPERIGLMGQSAGGGLAASLALLVRDRGEYRLSFQHLIYPMLDDRTGSGSDPNGFAGEFLWLAPSNRFAWSCLLGRAPGGPDVSPYAAAARAKNLSGLPRTFIATGALDLFIDENVEYAHRLIRSGVVTELHVYPGAYHGFDVFAAEAAVSRQACRDSIEALRRALRTP